MAASKATTTWGSVRRLQGGLIVSCQASEGEPLNAPEHILAMSLAAIAGGARALRLEGAENIATIRNCAKLAGNVPIVGLIKSAFVKPEDRLTSVYITSTFEEACLIHESGADIIALDATGRPRPDGLSVKETIEKIHKELNKPVWADCASFEQGVSAAEDGADIVSTTMYGYTKETALPSDAPPDLNFLKRLAEAVSIPVILEGRVWHPKEVSEAFERGAYAVVVGSAITRPTVITERFVRAIPHK